VLTAQETASLFEILRLFKEQGKTIILITHKLQEILDITDTVTVMRGGRVIGAVPTAGTTKEALANMMVGRPIENNLPRAPYNPGAPVLRVENLQLSDDQQVKLLADIGFTLRAGEIVAIAGVSGNGQSELMEILSGMRLPTSGKLEFLGKDLPFGSRSDADGLPRTFRELGIAHVPEDRLRDGVVKAFSVMHNTILGYQDKLKNKWGLLNFKAIAARCDALMKSFDVRPDNHDLRIGLLSGGNQQKVVIAREVLAQPKLMLVGQPTRGVDIGTIESIHKQLLALRDSGVAILLVSVELEEVRALADRILVMCGGRITGELKIEEFDTTRIGLLMGGMHKS
jgi:simple sugar transport system ATP-binding protein